MQNLFSYPIIIDELKANEQAHHLNANVEDLEYLKEVLQVEGVKKFVAEIKLKYNKKEHILDVWGTVSADLELQSVVSLENFRQKYAADFKLQYDTKMTRKDQKALEEVQDNVPDIITGGKIDLGDIAIQEIALLIDDHPRKPGERFKFQPEFDDSEPIKKNPFAALEKLKKSN